MPQAVRAAFVVLLVLSGCGSESTTSTPGLAPLAFDLVTHTGSFRAGQHALDAAEHRITGECMAENGFPYPVEARPVDARTDEERAIDLDSRRTSGYGLYDSWARTRSADGPDFPSKLDGYVARLPEHDRAVYRRALFGDEQEYRAIRLPDGSTTSFPAQGCVARARAGLFGDVVAWARVAYLPQTFNNIVTKRVTDDPDYAAAMGEWRGCMAARGYRFATPDDAAEQVSAGYRREGYTQTSRAHEIAVAVADGECARESRVPSRVLELKKKYLLRLPDHDRQALDAVTDAWADAVEAAKRGQA